MRPIVLSVSIPQKRPIPWRTRLSPRCSEDIRPRLNSCASCGRIDQSEAGGVPYRQEPRTKGGAREVLETAAAALRTSAKGVQLGARAEGVPLLLEIAREIVPMPEQAGGVGAFRSSQIEQTAPTQPMGRHSRTEILEPRYSMPQEYGLALSSIMTLQILVKSRLCRPRRSSAPSASTDRCRRRA